MALAGREVPVGLIHHADRGRQSCSNSYVERLREVGANKSHVNAGAADRKRLRRKLCRRRALCEEVYLHHYRTLEEAQAHLQTFLEDV